MDYMFSVLIPKSGLIKTNLVEIMAEWGGEIFSRNPREFKYDLELEFREIIDLNYFQGIIGSGFDVSDSVALYLQGNNIQRLEFIVNKQKLKIHDNKVLKLIYELYSTLDTFCIINEIEDERIDKKYFITNAKEAVDIFIDSLNWDFPRGIIIIKNENAPQ
jgi:hypothetical protein